METLTTALVCSLVSLSVCLPTPVLTVSPESPVQGEAMMISLPNTTSTLAVKLLQVGDNSITPFMFNGSVSGLYGVDITSRAGEYAVTADLADGTHLEKKVIVRKREKAEAPLGIPLKLGGNSASSQKTLVDTLTVENLQLASLVSGKKAFWSEPFRYPLEHPIVTDSYGYSRLTGSYTITHKGTDFRASSTTMVLAANRGVVRLVKTFRNYGNTVVVDHGLGVMTFYMHLSKIKVNPGELVLPGQLVGYAGQTGYAEKPHLHFTVRVNGSSVDPVEFLKLFSRS